jgi:hypothetical protein
MKEGIFAASHLVTLKLALEFICSGKPSYTIPKLMDSIFVVSLSFTVIGLLSLKFYTKDYLFDLKNTGSTGIMI